MKKLVFLTGGGTLGPVTPLLAIADAWRKTDSEIEFVWIGTSGGPERKLVEEAGIQFFSIRAPKLYRYLTLRLLLIPFELLISLIQSFKLLLQFRPLWVLSAGGYVSVPVAWCAHILGIKVAIHQLDHDLLLANKLMAPIADVVTATWPSANKQFKGNLVHVVGSPVYNRKSERMSREVAAQHFDVDPNRKTVFVTGGGGGSLAINKVMESIGEELTRDMNVIHQTGRGKKVFESGSRPDLYKTYELLGDDFGTAFGLADAVVTRAGLGTIGELVMQKKAAILIPLHGPQVENAQAVEDVGAGIVLREGELNSETLLSSIREVLEPKTRELLEKNISHLFPTTGVAEEIVEILRTR